MDEGYDDDPDGALYIKQEYMSAGPVPGIPRTLGLCLQIWVSPVFAGMHILKHLLCTACKHRSPEYVPTLQAKLTCHLQQSCCGDA